MYYIMIVKIFNSFIKFLRETFVRLSWRSSPSERVHEEDLKNSFVWRSQSCDFAKLCASAFHFLPSESDISRESLTSVPQFLHSRLLGFGDWSSEWRSKSLQGSPLFTSLQVSFYRKSYNFSKLFYLFIYFFS